MGRFRKNFPRHRDGAKIEKKESIVLETLRIGRVIAVLLLLGREKRGGGAGRE